MLDWNNRDPVEQTPLPIEMIYKSFIDAITIPGKQNEEIYFSNGWAL